MSRQKLETDKIAADVAKANAEAAAVTKTAAAAMKKAAAATKTAAAVTKMAAAAMKKADEDAKAQAHKRRLTWGSVGVTTIASLYLWLDWLYHDSDIGLEWHIKRFLKKSSKYNDPQAGGGALRQRSCFYDGS